MLDFAADYSRRILLVAAATILLGYILVALSGVVLPILVAVLVTALLYPAAAWLRRHGWPKLLATIAVMGTTLLVVLGLLTLVGPATASQLDELAIGAQEGLTRVTGLVAQGPFGLTEAEIDRRVDEAIDQVRQNLGGLASRVASGALVAVNLLAGVVIVLFLVFFFIKDGEQMAGWLVRLPRPEWRDDARELGRRSFEILTVYARSVVAVAVVDGVLIGLALLAIGVPLALPLAILTFLGAFFPLIGAVVAGAVAVLVALVAEGPSSALLVLVAVLVVQQVEGNVLYPLLVGGSLNLHPAVILLTLTAGSLIAGIAGALFAVPAAAVFSACASYLRERAHDPEGAEAA